MCKPENRLFSPDVESKIPKWTKRAFDESYQAQKEAENVFYNALVKAVQKALRGTQTSKKKGGKMKGDFTGICLGGCGRQSSECKNTCFRWPGRARKKALKRYIKKIPQNNQKRS